MTLSSPQGADVHRSFRPSQDLWVDQRSPDSPADAASETLVARHEGEAGSRLLLEFDLGAEGRGEIQSASLTLELLQASGQAEVPIATSALRSTFDAKTSWLTQPSRSKTYAIQTTSSAPAPITWDVTQLIKEHLSADGSFHGIALSGPFEGSYERTFGSAESNSPPRLDVVAAPVPAAEDPEPGGTALRVAVAGAIAVIVAIAVVLEVRRRRSAASS